MIAHGDFVNGLSALEQLGLFVGIVALSALLVIGAVAGGWWWGGR